MFRQEYEQFRLEWLESGQRGVLPIRITGLGPASDLEGIYVVEREMHCRVCGQREWSCPTKAEVEGSGLSPESPRMVRRFSSLDGGMKRCDTCASVWHQNCMGYQDEVEGYIPVYNGNPRSSNPPPSY